MTDSRVEKFIVDTFLYGDTKGLSSETSLTEAGIVDSTGILELISFLEKAYSITVKDEELIPENLDSLQQIAQFIRSKVGA